MKIKPRNVCIRDCLSITHIKQKNKTSFFSIPLFVWQLASVPKRMFWPHFRLQQAPYVEVEKLGCEDGGLVHSGHGSTNEVQVLSFGDEFG